MPAVRDEAICIRHWDWSETSQTVSLFGRSLGLLRGLAKGARRERGRFGGGLDLLDRGEVGAITRSESELATLTDWELLESFPRLRDQLWNNRAAFYAADLIQRMLAPQDSHPRLYDALVGLLRSLGSATVGANGAEIDEPGPVALLRFQWILICETGFQPALEAPLGDDGRSTFHFSSREGGLVPAGSAQAWKVRKSTIDLLRGLADGAGSGMRPVDLQDTATVDRANRLLAAYLRDIVGTEPPTLAQLFGALGVRSSGPRPGSMPE